VYVYRKNDDRERVMEEKANVEGWTKQVVGGNPSDRFCYNCAQNSHFGDVSKNGNHCT
jgi:protein AIR1/2